MPIDTRTRRVTLSDVAERAGVSVAAVSLALNGRGRISLEMRDRIHRIAAELGYPVRTVRRTQSGGVSTVGVLLERRLFDVVDSFYFQILRGLQAESEKRGLQVLFSTVGAEHVKQGWRSVFPANAQVDAVIVVGVTDPDFIASFRAESFPVVFVAAGVKGASEFDTVVSDDFQAMEQIFQHLVRLGHRDIAYVGGRLDQLAAVNRLRAFKIHMEEFLGATRPDLIEIAEEGSEQSAGFETCTTLLARKVRFTAMICATDEMARGAAEALIWSGLRIPEDVSIVGFENKEIAEIIRPPLTTVQVNCHEMGKIACELLSLRMSEVARISPLHVLVSPELIVRGSTGSACEGAAPWTRSRYGDDASMRIEDDSNGAGA